MRRANDNDYSMLKGILQSQGPNAAMQRIGQFRNQIDPRDLRAAEMAVKQFAKGGMVRAESSYKANGGWVGNYAYGGATPESHPGKPVGTDQVPAWLTEGEFVIDQDSANGTISPTEKQDLISVIEESDTLALSLNGSTNGSLLKVPPGKLCLLYTSPSPRDS